MQTKRKISPGLLLLRLLKGQGGRLACALLATVGMTVITYLTPLLLSEVVDTVLDGKPSALPDFLLDPLRSLSVSRSWLRSRMWVPALALVALNLFNGVFSYLRGRLNAVASERVICDLRNRLFVHLQSLPFAYHAQAQTGDLIQRCTSDVDTVRRFLSMQIMEIVNALLMIVIALTVLLQRSVRLTLYSVVLVPGLFVFAGWFFARVHKSFQAADEAEGRMSAVLQENLSGVRVVRAFGQQQREVEKFDRVNADFRNKAKRVNDLLAVYWGGGDAISNIQSLITLAICVVAAVRGEITTGGLILFTSYVSQLLWPVRQLGRTLSDSGKSMVAMERIQAILDAEPEPPEPDAIRPPLNGDIVFDHVSFAYPDDPAPVITDVSFTVPAGSTTAILGGTGSGKSTLLYLLQRLYEPTGGRITIGGTDIRRIDRKYLRAHVGLILQEPFLYSKTIEENVGIARERISRAEAEHAAQIASAADFIRQADKGWDTVVGERGVTLSGGQKQRLAIARTLLKDNDILAFDDSLSAVDTETDAQIRAALSREKAGVTTLIISHRITTLSQADQIIVLEDGKVSAVGTHEALCRQPGLYQRINSIQNSLEEELAASREEVNAHAGH